MRTYSFLILLSALFLAGCGRSCQSQLANANYSNGGQVDEACYNNSNYNNYGNNNGYGTNSGYNNYNSNTGYNPYGYSGYNGY